ncbi:hypothetical protein CTAYLR_001207 [Chrysophaeum taylorii]|uniref:Uncharacterized protein n=1 Tax=Chrysophaeum taylorii TaxID=2483200 RepID=A0AAD7UCP7_9STRA|nr:hypothetical protein CTAYLR_001207 [Chrysophaeum taylorii]
MGLSKLFALVDAIRESNDNVKIKKRWCARVSKWVEQVNEVLEDPRFEEVENPPKALEEMVSVMDEVNTVMQMCAGMWWHQWVMHEMARGAVTRGSLDDLEKQLQNGVRSLQWWVQTAEVAATRDIIERFDRRFTLWARRMLRGEEQADAHRADVLTASRALGADATSVHVEAREAILVIEGHIEESKRIERENLAENRPITRQRLQRRRLLEIDRRSALANVCNESQTSRLWTPADMPEDLRLLQGVDADDVSIKRINVVDDGVLRDLEVAAAVSHENIVRLLGICFVDGCLCAVNDVVRATLEDAIGRDSLNDRGRALRAARDIAAGMAYLHDCGIVHRDLRPKTVAVDLKTAFCRVADFGFSRDVVATYAAPEILARGWTSLSRASDVYSYGCLLLEMISGRRPWRSLTDDEIVASIATFPSSPASPASHTSRAAPELRVLADECLKSRLDVVRLLDNGDLDAALDAAIALFGGWSDDARRVAFVHECGRDDFLRALSTVVTTIVDADVVRVEHRGHSRDLALGIGTPSSSSSHECDDAEDGGASPAVRRDASQGAYDAYVVVRVPPVVTTHVTHRRAAAEQLACLRRALCEARGVAPLGDVCVADAGRATVIGDLVDSTGARCLMWCGLGGGVVYEAGADHDDDLDIASLVRAYSIARSAVKPVLAIIVATFGARQAAEALFRDAGIDFVAWLRVARSGIEEDLVRNVLVPAATWLQCRPLDGSRLARQLKNVAEKRRFCPRCTPEDRAGVFFEPPDDAGKDLETVIEDRLHHHHRDVSLKVYAHDSMPVATTNFNVEDALSELRCSDLCTARDLRNQLICSGSSHFVVAGAPDGSASDRCRAVVAEVCINFAREPIFAFVWKIHDLADLQDLENKLAARRHEPMTTTITWALVWLDAPWAPEALTLRLDDLARRYGPFGIKVVVAAPSEPAAFKPSLATTPYRPIYLRVEDDQATVSGALHDEVVRLVPIIPRVNDKGPPFFDQASLKSLAAVLDRRLPFKGCLVGLYLDDDESVHARFCVTNVVHLRELGTEIFENRLDDGLAEAGLPFRVDTSHFVAAFEYNIRKLTALTIHQATRLHKYAAERAIVVVAPAGGGKTFIALDRIQKSLKAATTLPVLYVARNREMAIFVVNWLLVRLAGCWGRVETRLRVSFQHFDKGPWAVSVREGRVVLASEKRVRQDYHLVVVDEAHSIFDDLALRKQLESTITSCNHVLVLVDGGQSGRVGVNDADPRRLATPILNSVATSPARGKATPCLVELTQVVRSTKRIVCGVDGLRLSAPAATVECRTPGLGFPLETFLFPANSPEKAEISDDESMDAATTKDYVKFVGKAFDRIQVVFGDLHLDGRVAIIVPTMAFKRRIQPLLGQTVGDEYNLIFVDALEASERVFSTASAFDHQSPDVRARIVLDTVDNMNGLERLIVICAGLDAPYVPSRSSREGVVTDDVRQCARQALRARSRLYVGFSRAQMAVFVVNKDMQGGWLQYLKFLRFSNNTDDIHSGLDEIDRRAVRKRVNYLRSAEVHFVPIGGKTSSETSRRPMPKAAKVNLDDAIAALKSNDVLLCNLDLSFQRIDSTSLKTLVPAIQANATLRRLVLNDNMEIGPQGVARLAPVIAANQCSLEELSLQRTDIGDNGAKIIANALRTNETLTRLNLGSNKVHYNGISSLALALHTNRMLLHLGLMGNEVGYLDAQVLVNLLTPGHLKCLDLRYASVHFSQQEAQVACRVLLGDDLVLESLDLRDNSVDEDAKMTIRAVLPRISTAIQL